MKSTISLNQPSSKASLSDRFSRWLETDDSFFSYYMEESVTHRQALLVYHAFLAGMLLVFSTFTNVTAAVILAAWFLFAINLCQKGGLR